MAAGRFLTRAVIDVAGGVGEHVQVHRPLLFLDVDGTLIPFGGSAYPTYHADTANPLLARLDPAHGPRLSALSCELVWATTWRSDANDHIAPLLGLAPLPLVDWPDTDGDEPVGVHWKTPVLVAYAAGRPFVWVDDEIGAADRSWVAAHHRGDALLHKVDPRTGIAGDDYSILADWCARTRMAD